MSPKTPTYTPGPWRLGQGGSVVADTPVEEVQGSDDIEYYGGHLIAESIAPRNQHLIAAAPELLAKLKDIHSHRSCSCRLEPFVDGPVPCETCQIGSLVAKAEGRS